jgi:hypothetical protein
MRMPGGLSGPVLAGVAAALALVAAGRSLWNAVEIEPPPATIQGEPVRQAAMEARTAHPLREALVATERDPFRSDRRRAPWRFRPEEPAPVFTASVTADAPPQSLRLMGTVALPAGRGAALSQLGSQPARLVRVGETIGEYTLQAVQQGAATFVSSTGERLELKVPRAGG